MLFRFRDKSEWHRWFAWRPVKVGDAWRWLEHVERRVFWVGNWGGCYCVREYR